MERSGILKSLSRIQRAVGHIGATDGHSLPVMKAVVGEYEGGRVTWRSYDGAYHKVVITGTIILIACHLGNSLHIIWRSRINGKIRDLNQWWPGGHLNIKLSSYQYRDSYVKDKTVSRPSYRWHGNPILEKKTVLLLRQAPGSLTHIYASSGPIFNRLAAIW